MAAIVQVESGGNPFAIDDNTTRRSYYHRDRASAKAFATELTGAGHLVDAGIAQIDSMNFARLGVNPLHSGSPAAPIPKDNGMVWKKAFEDCSTVK